MSCSLTAAECTLPGNKNTNITQLITLLLFTPYNDDDKVIIHVRSRNDSKLSLNNYLTLKLLILYIIIKIWHPSKANVTIYGNYKPVHYQLWPLKLLNIWGSCETYQPLTVEQRSAAASSDGPVAEVKHMVDLLSQLGGILVLGNKPQSALLGHTLDRKWDYSD